MVLLSLQAHEIVQGTAKHTNYIALHSGIGFDVGGLERIGISLADLAEGLLLARGFFLVPSSFPRLPLPTFDQLTRLIFFVRLRDAISGTLKMLLCLRGTRSPTGATLVGVDC